MKFVTAARVQLPPQMNLGPLCLRLPGTGHFQGDEGSMGRVRIWTCGRPSCLRVLFEDHSDIANSSLDPYFGGFEQAKCLNSQVQEKQKQKISDLLRLYASNYLIWFMFEKVNLPLCKPACVSWV